MNWVATGAIFLVFAVGLGAFGAHGLRPRLEELGTASIYEKAVFYHFVHAIGLVLVALLARTNAISASAQITVGWLLTIGIIIFSGSLYTLALTGVRILGAITPIGGLGFIGAWIVLAWSAFTYKP